MLGNPQLDSGSVQRCSETSYGCVEKVFTNLRRELDRSGNHEMFDLKTNVLIWGLLMSTTMKSAVHLCRISTKIDRVQVHELRRNQRVVRCHLNFERGNFIRNSEFIYFYIRFVSLDEIDSVP